LTLSTQHPITTTPNALPDTLGFTPTKPGDDSGDAKESIAGISYGLIAFDNDANVTNGGQVIYYAFDIDDIDNPDIQWILIENSANWLRKVIPPA
jgi:hypothetical protein